MNSSEKAARIAGLFFLFNFAIPGLNWSLVLSKFIVPENGIATAKNIVADEFLFRMGLAIELAMSVGLIVLAIALYALTKQVNKNLALLALTLKVVEATLVASLVLISFVFLQFMDGSAYLTEFTPGQLQAPVGFLLNIHTALFSLPMVFLGLDMMIFSYLLFKSKYIPGTISVFGIFSFALILIHAVMFLLAPKYAGMPINQVIFWAPSGLFEIVVGTWLLTKTVNVPTKYLAEL